MRFANRTPPAGSVFFGESTFASVLEVRRIARVRGRRDQRGNIGGRIVEGDGRDGARVGVSFLDLDGCDAFHPRQRLLDDRRAEFAGGVVDIEDNSLFSGLSGDSAMARAAAAILIRIMISLLLDSGLGDRLKK
jgi:hypothetical protein